MKNQMKQMSKSIAVTIGLAIPSTTLAWNITKVTTATNQLKESLKTQNVNGLNITNPSPAKILDAVGKVGGKATVHTGNGKSINIDIQEKSADGTVIVGSGANGLVATSNFSGNGGTVVISPPPMTTSITVVTPDDDLESHSGSLCLIKLPNDFSKYQRTFINKPRSSNFMIDVNFNKSFRINAGKYILLQSIAHCEVDRYSSLYLPTFHVFEIKDGENAIFYLRKLTIKSSSDITNGNVNIFYQLKTTKKNKF